MLFIFFGNITKAVSASSNKLKLPMRAYWYVLSICGLSVLILLDIISLRYHSKRSQTSRFPEAVPLFISTQLDQAVSVPFTSYHGNIVVLADFNGTSISCMIDSGARDIATNIDLHCKRVGNPISNPLPTGVYVPAEFVQVPQIKLGGYQLSNVPVVSLVASGTFPAYPGGIAQNGLLGNYAFKNTVLTIDYVRQTLTIHPTSYDITRQPRREQDALLDLTFHGSDVNFAPDIITARGSIEGVPIDITIDTGNSSDGLLISPALRQRLTMVERGTIPRSDRNGLFGQWAYEETRPLRWTLGNASGWTPGLTIAMRSDVDCWIGYQALKNYRVTIDYPRKKLLLEPYDR